MFCKANRSSAQKDDIAWWLILHAASGGGVWKKTEITFDIWKYKQYFWIEFEFIWSKSKKYIYCGSLYVVCWLRSTS